MKLNGNKQNMGLVLAGLGVVLEYFNVQYGHELMVFGLGLAGFGASHKIVKGV